MYPDDKTSANETVGEPESPAADPSAPAAGSAWREPAEMSFGAYLRYLRESFPERTGRNRPGAVKVRLTALALIDCLASHHYSITSGYYSELERGTALPKEAGEFVEAVGKCLELGGVEQTKLLLQLGYETAIPRFGEKYAREMFQAAAAQMLPAQANSESSDSK